jgi:DNA polymerase III alpha subunit (gram-positive type)
MVNHTTQEAMRKFNRGDDYKLLYKTTRSKKLFLGQSNWLLSRARNATLPSDTMYLTWDIETTGLNKAKVDIIEIGCVAAVWKHNSWNILSPTWQSYVFSTQFVSPFIRKLTGISPKVVHEAPELKTVIDLWKKQIEQWKQQCKTHKIVLVAHNGDRYDLPCLQNNLKRRLGLSFTDICRDLCIVATMDTLVLARKLIWPPTKFSRRSKQGKRQSRKLGDLYFYVRGREFEAGHTALADAKAMYPVMAYMLRCLGSGAWKRQQTSTK